MCETFTAPCCSQHKTRLMPLITPLLQDPYNDFQQLLQYLSERPQVEGPSDRQKQLLEYLPLLDLSQLKGRKTTVLGFGSSCLGFKAYRV